MRPPPRLHADRSLRAGEPLLSRRTVLATALAGAGLLLVPARGVLGATPFLVENVTRLYAVEVARVLRPRSREAVRDAVLQWPGRIAVGGGCYSMGGQVAVAGGLHLDMREMNRLVWVRPET